MPSTLLQGFQSLRLFASFFMRKPSIVTEKSPANVKATEPVREEKIFLRTNPLG